MTTENETADEVLDFTRVRKLLPVSAKTLHSAIKEKRDLPAFFTVGHRTFWRKSVVLAWIEQKERESQEAKSLAVGADDAT